MSAARAGIALIPYVGGVINEVVSYHSEKYLEQRLLQFEQALTNQGRTIDELKEKSEKFDEHQYYAVRNNLRHLLATAAPETTPAFIRALLDSIFKEDYAIPEAMCEIITHLNASDIEFLKYVHSFRIKNVDKMEAQHIASQTPSTDALGLKERNRNFKGSTIMWDDFCTLKFSETYQHKTVPFEGLVVINFDTNNLEVCEGNPLQYNFLGYSLIKMQRLGIIMPEFVVTLGTTNPNNIDRFHITGFGNSLLDYIKDGD